MHTLTVFLEENAFGAVRPVEVGADVPVATLIPRLLDELDLPRTDLFGKKLIYMLRDAGGGRVLPEQATLQAAGVQQGSRLALDSFVLDGSVATIEQQNPSRQYNDPSLHSSDTVADLGPIIPMGAPPRWPDPNRRPSAPNRPQPPQKSSRRAFLLAGGALVGVVAAGAGYVAYAQFMRGMDGTKNVGANTGPTNTQPPPPTTPTFPTTAQVILTFARHRQTVRSVAWTSNGTMLASGADDAHLLIWDTTGTVQHDLRHPASVRALAWSPDEQRIVTGANHQVTFIDAQQGKILATSTRQHTQMITDLAWTSHNQMQVVSGAADKHAIVWDTTTYRPLRVYARHNAAIQSVSWGVDGQTVASSSQRGLVRIWNAANAQDLHLPYQDAQKPMRAMAFAPQGFQLAVGGDDGIVRIWNAQNCATTGKQLCMDMPQRLQISQKAVRALAWSPDGRMLAVGADDGTFSLWALAKPQKPLLTRMQENAVHHLSWSPDGKQLAMAVGNTVLLWKLV